MNISIITVLLSGIILRLGLWRQQAGFLSLFIIWSYILMIGFPASAVRAGLMASLVFIAQNVGRLADGSRVLIFAASIILFENPLLLRYDLGFQLSFLAMAGLIWWQPFFKEKIFKKLPEFARFNFSATFSAQVFTLPVLIYNFGYVSLVSPLTNLLLIQLIPYLTMASFAAGILGMLLLPLGRILAAPLWFGTSFMLLLADFSLKIPWAFLETKNIPVWLLVIILLLLGLLTRRIRKKYPWWLE